MKTIYTHPIEVKEVANYIYNNIKTCYINTIGDYTYYNVNGIVWQVWQSGCGNYPTTNGTLFINF